MSSTTTTTGTSLFPQIGDPFAIGIYEAVSVSEVLVRDVVITAPADGGTTTSSVEGGTTTSVVDGGTTTSVVDGGTTTSGTAVTPTLSFTTTSTDVQTYVIDSTAATSSFSTTNVVTPNAIVLENMKQGTPQSVWDLLSGPSSDIEGFTTDISYDLGQTVSFKINTDSSNYRVEIYRLGYYGGDGARLVDTINHEAASATLQPTPLRDLDTGLVDAGNWSVTDTWSMTSDAVSGIYIAKLVREDGTFGENHIPFIVRDSTSTSDIVFQTSDSTWQAYNGWGGANLYGGNGPGGDSAPGRAYAVSYNRPITTREGGGYAAGAQDFIFGAEYSAVRWLEANGYDVSYISSVDTARYGENLLNHQVFLDVGHDEYWSGEQRANVEAARDAGVNLAFLSGNAMYWKTRWEASIDGSETDYRTMVSYKETRAGTKIDPSAEWTGTWRDLSYDPAAGGQTPENALQGTQFQVDSYRLDTIEIPYDMTQLRFWRNTAVAETAAGETAQLVQNLLGYEWDIAPDNSFTPDGLIRLSSSTLAVNTLLYDYGTSVGPGIATHNLTLYRAESGALVFGAGTVYWSWGLDANHDLESTPTDASVQQAMVNLFADMGVQAQTLQADLLPATASIDFTAPTSTINAVTGTVAEGQRVTLSGNMVDIGGRVAGVEVSTDGGTSWWAAAFDTAAGTWSYTWTAPAAGSYELAARAVDDSLNMGYASAPLTVTVAEASHVSLFSLTDTPPPLPENWDPSQAAVCCNICVVHVFGPAEVGVKFSSERSGTVSSVRFYKDDRNTGTHVGKLWSADGTLLATATFINETGSGWQQVNFAQPITIAAGTVYIASYSTTAGIYLASHGTYFAESHTSGPLTALASDWNTGPNGVIGEAGSFPIGQVQSSMNYWVDVVFDPATVVGNTGPTAAADGGLTTDRDSTLVISATALLANDTDPNGDPLSIVGVSGATNGTVAWDYYRQIITFTPGAGFVGTANFTYTVTDGRGATSQAVASIDVEEPPLRFSLFAATATPEFKSVADASPVELGVRFVSSTNGSISGIRFYKGSLNTGVHTANLWSAEGALLATATFSAETASGWQQVSFSNAVNITAGQTYVASYHTTSGMYSATPGFFNESYSAGVLSVAGGGSGLYAYGVAGSFPTQTYSGTNYWVDVTFEPAISVNVDPVAVADTGLVVARNVPLGIAAVTLLGNDTDANADVLTITGVSGATNGTVAYDPQTGIITFTPDSGYTGPAGFAYAISDGRGGTAETTVSMQVVDLGEISTLFQPGAVPAVASAADPNPIELGMRFSVTQNGSIAGIRFYKGVQNTGTHVGNLWSAEGTLLATATFAQESASGWQQVLFAQPVNLVTGQTYIASYHTDSGYYSVTPGFFNASYSQGVITATGGSNGVYAYGSGGFPTQTYNASNYWVDVVFSSGNASPTAVGESGLIVQGNTPLVISLASLLANDSDPNGDALAITGISGVAGGTAVFDALGGTITFTADAGYIGAASFTYTVGDSTGATSQAVASMDVVETGSNQRLFSAFEAPATTATADPSAVELGVQFTADVGGLITGIRFYKGAQNTGTHVGSLWTGSGTLLATATFTNETASGWQQVDFAEPVNIAAGQTYVASYHTTTGNYAATSAYFTGGHDNGVLSASNGLYTYGAGGVMPNQSWNATNYWVDVVMDARNRNPTATADGGFTLAQGASLVIPVATLLANDQDADGDAFTLTGVSAASGGTVAYDAQAQTVTFTADAGHSGPAGFTYGITDARGGTAEAAVALNVQAPATTDSLFASGQLPAVLAVNDPSSIELGVRFSADQAGSITGIRYYKSEQNTGTHTGSLWTATGTLLATATFTNETASGWQQVDFAAPVSIAANTDYVASYHTDTGFYAASGAFFTQPYESGPLNAPAGNNGLYAYGASQFPTGSWNSTNYWVDVAYQGQLAA
ncbi:DUF4082 domain-containing protein [Neoroseomonas lacus]|uniref:DUF4082 domain-containing protein n=1 Tax=Neoroseomonas lacus TaxID=287609 RepID=A0A917KM22_9PROT|nr:DUF4082 domain-containing protein [Neoroseomonas lacus]GGJ20028.1 hypothetical protein GCM10011320_29130 [Neoroseomonas lacus]